MSSSIMKMQKAVTAAKMREHKYVMLSTKDGEIRTSIDELLYVEVTNHHLQIVTLHGTYTVFDSLNRFEKQFPEGRFARCSQSYLVNLMIGYIFPLELLFAVIVYMLPLSKRKGSIGRLFIFLAAVGIVLLCCDVALVDAVHCVAFGYATQHTAYCLHRIMFHVVDPTALDQYTAGYYLVYIAVYVSFYFRVC